MTLDLNLRELIPEPVEQILSEYARGFGLDLHLWAPLEDGQMAHLYPPRQPVQEGPQPRSMVLSVPLRSGPELVLEARGSISPSIEPGVHVLRTTLERLYEQAEEIRFFTYEMAERYEEINLLYSIAETLGSLLRIRDAAPLILNEVCDVMGARRGALWFLSPVDGELYLAASAGAGGEADAAHEPGSLSTAALTTLTAVVFRDGRPLILPSEEESRGDSVLSVPIRYTPPSGEPRTVGVIHLMGKRHGGQFTASDQRLLSAIASQVGASLENHRLLEVSLERERVEREMELAHDLQQKLLPSMDAFDPVQIGGRVEPADEVGGDFFHVFPLKSGRMAVMIGDVSSHGFPAALIMALSISAATIYAMEVEAPDRVLLGMAQALQDELESTEMYLTLFYGVLDPERSELVYASAGHPYAFRISGDGEPERLHAIDPPLGIGDPSSYRSRTVPWRAGVDLLLLFTDGLSDPLDPSGFQAGEQRVLETVQAQHTLPARTVVDALFDLEREGDTSRGDDRTAVVLRL
jgi:sigma-B regulation protein RsbU (phosphoserine phosphatase)